MPIEAPKLRWLPYLAYTHRPHRLIDHEFFPFFHPCMQRAIISATRHQDTSLGRRPPFPTPYYSQNRLNEFNALLGIKQPMQASNDEFI